jgi:hypothetical protein
MESIKSGLGIIFDYYNEIMRGLPDSIFLGSIVFAFLTQNYPLSILVLGMFEFSIVAWFLSMFVGLIETNNESVKSDICLPGIPSPYLISILGNIYPKISFPSIPIFFMSSTLFYIVYSVLNFSNELKELGHKNAEWKVRIPLSIIFTVTLIMAFIFWRVLNTCDSLWFALGSLLFGALTGACIQVIHTYLFGRDAVNFLGVPLLADKSVTGDSINICANQSQ